jgi:transcriptional antiterminator RfaH
MNLPNVNDPPRWYVIHTKPKQEDRAESNLKAWRVETFVPRVRKRRGSYIDGMTYSVRPLFPRYIFARFQASSLLHKISFTRGVCNVVSFGDSPTPVDDEVVNIILSQAGNDGFIRIGEELKYGDKVMIKKGPFSNLTGIFERELKDSERVMILLTTVNYQSHIMVDREFVMKINQMN